MKEKYSGVAKRIEDLLYLKKMTQRELADKLGIRAQTLSVWLREKRNPKMKTIERIAKALDVPIKELIEDNIDSVRNKSKNKDWLSKFKDYEERLLKVEKEILDLKNKMNNKK